jgi:hypothetical protein
MNSSSARQLRKSETLKRIGGVRALRNFRKGTWVRDNDGEMHRLQMPRRARALLLAKICSERGKKETAKRMALISAREYLFHKRESVGTGETCNSGSYALAKMAADLGGLEKKEFKAIVQEAMEKHVAANSLFYAMILGVQGDLHVQVVRLAEHLAGIFEARGDSEGAERIRYTYLQRLPREDDIQKASRRRIDYMRREFGEEGRARFSAAIRAKVHFFRGEHEEAEEQAKIAGLGMNEVREAAAEIRKEIDSANGAGWCKQRH